MLITRVALIDNVILDNVVLGVIDAQKLNGAVAYYCLGHKLSTKK